MTENELLMRAQRLDPQALGAIHDQFYPEIYRYIRYRLDDEQLCEDLSADVFLRLLDALHRSKGPERNLRGWLFGTASNLINDHLRRQYSRKQESLDSDWHVLADEQHLEGAFEETWRQEQVRRALSELTEVQQHVLALRFSHERSLEETAQVMGKSVTAVKALQFRAINALRRLLERQQVIIE